MYHTRLHCYVAIELKVVEFQPEFISKLNYYISAIDDLVKMPEDNPTIVLLLCRSKNTCDFQGDFFVFSALNVYFAICTSKILQKSSAIQKISVTLSPVIIAKFFSFIVLIHYKVTKVIFH